MRTHPTTPRKISSRSAPNLQGERWQADERDGGAAPGWREHGGMRAAVRGKQAVAIRPWHERPRSWPRTRKPEACATTEGAAMGVNGARGRGPPTRRRLSYIARQPKNANGTIYLKYELRNLSSWPIYYYGYGPVYPLYRASYRSGQHGVGR